MTKHQILDAPLTIADQGSFYVGGTRISDSSGNTTFTGHAYVSYQQPLQPRALPMVMWHGGGHHGKTWESTAEGREGYNTIWLRAGYSVYVVDEPYMGRGGKPPVPVQVSVRYDDQRCFQSFRYGSWQAGDAEPEYFPDSQAPQGDEALAQLQKQVSPHLLEAEVPRPESPDGTAIEALPYPEAVTAATALFDELGPAILVNHSHGGFLGWSLALRSTHVKGIVSYEPVRFIYPEGEMPEDLGLWQPSPQLRALQQVSREEFRKLTRFPIQIVYGDYLAHPGNGKWRDAVRAAEVFVALVNRHGGDAEILHLPDAGLKGNSHFPFADGNNRQVAELMAGWLRHKGLDSYPKRD